MARRNIWALVLAAGEGFGLRKLTTTTSGASVPKQFCSLNGGPSLFEQALGRAFKVAPRSGTCAIVATHHWIWWQGLPHGLPSGNIIVQPANRGTANGVLLALLHILARDPQADVLILPSDHHVREENVLAAAIESAIEQLQWHASETLLFGFVPQEADPELGYIIPKGNDGAATLGVDRFVEKPSPTQARQIIKQGGLWNGFIVAARGQSLLNLYRRRCPDLLKQMRTCVQHAILGDKESLPRLYASLPTIDFSRDILQGQESRLRVLRVANCGWSDLGTLGRVERVLRTSPGSRPAFHEPLYPSFLSLAMQYDQQHHPDSRPAPSSI
jgi:mannose-1-phosphate guanylyltransferase